jgi:hypothetical protein
MFGGFGSLVPGFDVATVGPALGVVSAGVWLLRLQRVAVYFRLAGLLAVLLGFVLAAGMGTDVLQIDVRALADLVHALGAWVGRAVRAFVGASGGV